MLLGVIKGWLSSKQKVWLGLCILQPLSKILVKLDHFPKDRGENKEYLKPPSSIYLELFVMKIGAILDAAIPETQQKSRKHVCHSVLWSCKLVGNIRNTNALR